MELHKHAAGFRVTNRVPVKSGKTLEKIKVRGKRGKKDDEINNESPSRRYRERLRRDRRFDSRGMTGKYCCC